MVNKKIDIYQIASLVFFITISLFPLTIKKIIKLSGSDCLISIILGSIMLLLIFKFILWFRKNINLKNKLIKFILILGYLLFFIFLIIDTTNFIKVSFLSNGNFYSILILLLLMCLSSSNQSYKELSSLSLILGFIFIPLVIITIIGASHTIDLSYLKIPFSHNIFTILKGSIVFFFYEIFPLSLLLFIPSKKIDNEKKQDKYLYLALILGIFLIILEYLLLYFTCSINLLSNYNYPFTLVLNSISSTFILERLTYITSFYLLFPLIITLSLIICVIKHLIKNKNNQDLLT